MIAFNADKENQTSTKKTEHTEKNKIIAKPQPRINHTQPRINHTLSIVLTGGGTAGHVLPHLALLPHLEKAFKNIYYIGSHNGIEREIIEKIQTIKYFPITTVKLRRSFSLKNVLIPFKALKGIQDAKKVLKLIKPDIVFSKGGFVAFPVAYASSSLKIPVIAHESDMSLGLANRLCAKHCKTICTTFARTANTENKKPKNHNKFVHTASPIRANLFSGNKEIILARHAQVFKPSLDKPNLLITGGSLGAMRLNQIVRDSLQNLIEDFNIIHLCGRGKIDTNINMHGYIQIEYAHDIENYFAWSDVVVSRAGSNTLCELMALKKPTLFVPLSRQASRGDQIENALEMQKHDTAMVLFEEEMTKQAFTRALNHLVINKRMYETRIRKLGNFDGTQKIAKIIIDTALANTHTSKENLN